MVKKYSFGKPFETGAVVSTIIAEQISSNTFTTDEGVTFTDDDNLNICFPLGTNDMVFGLGENTRGINKRGYWYTSYCSDVPMHTEDRNSLYAAHNFIIINSAILIGIFVDHASKVNFDIGYTHHKRIDITCESNCDVYIITGDSLNDISRQFRRLIGTSYLPPYWAFGYQQSRWSYASKDAVRDVVKSHRENNIPLDSVILDIDYMERYKDFTFNNETFGDIEDFVDEMKSQNIHLIPIIDAGVKIEDGYDVYEEGVRDGHFCKDEEGNDFKAAVWPGLTHFPDFFQEKTRTWFGDKYKILLDKGFEGFWNDMNEPAIFYTEKGLDKFIDFVATYKGQNVGVDKFFDLKNAFNSIENGAADYSRLMHNIDGELVSNDKVHNLYGTYMTLAATDSFRRNAPDKRILMYSRASSIGMHRYSGIWTGDNCSWWSHLLLNIQMMPSLNMCGFLYSGADLGGFGSNVSMDLLLRWLAFGVFTPLMRNHAALGTRDQEVYKFNNNDKFRNIINFRYRFIPHLYSEFMKAVRNNNLLFKPLAFEYEDDEIAAHIEDQLLLGDGIMIAPVYTQNAIGRTVYLPEDMLYVNYNSEGAFTCQCYTKGHHFIKVALDEIPFFIRPNHAVPFANVADSTDNINTSELCYIVYHKYNERPVTYTLYEDDGITPVINTDVNSMHQVKFYRETAGTASCKCNDNRHISYVTYR